MILAPGWEQVYDTAHVCGCEVEYSAEVFRGSRDEPSACDVEILSIEPAEDFWVVFETLLLREPVGEIVWACVEKTGRWPESVEAAIRAQMLGEMVDAIVDEVTR